MSCLSINRAKLLDDVLLGYRKDSDNILMIGNLPISEEVINRYKQSISNSNSKETINDWYVNLIKLEYGKKLKSFSKEKVDSINNFINSAFSDYGSFEDRKKEFFKFFEYLKVDLFERLFTAKSAYGVVFNNISNFNDYYNVLNNLKNFVIAKLSNSYKDKDENTILREVKDKYNKGEKLVGYERMLIVADYMYKLKEAHEEYIKDAGKENSKYKVSPLKAITDILLENIPISPRAKSRFYKIPDKILAELKRQKIEKQKEELKAEAETEEEVEEEEVEEEEVTEETQEDIITELSNFETNIVDVQEEEEDLLSDFNERGINEVMDIAFEKPNIRLTSKNVRELLKFIPNVNIIETKVEIEGKKVTRVIIEEAYKKNSLLPNFFSPEYILEALRFAFNRIENKNNWREELIKGALEKKFGRYNKALLSFAVRYLSEFSEENSNIDSILFFGNEDIDTRYRVIISKDNEHIQTFNPYLLHFKKQQVPEYSQSALFNIINEVISVQPYNNVWINNNYVLKTPNELLAINLDYVLDKAYNSILNDLDEFLSSNLQTAFPNGIYNFSKDNWQNRFNEAVNHTNWGVVKNEINQKLLSPLETYISTMSDDNPYLLFLKSNEVEFELQQGVVNKLSNNSYIFKAKYKDLEYEVEIDKELFSDSKDKNLNDLAKELFTRFALYRLITNSTDIFLVHDYNTKRLGIIREDKDIFSSVFELNRFIKENNVKVEKEQDIRDALENKIKQSDIDKFEELSLKSFLKRNDLNYLYNLRDIVVFRIDSKETIEERNNFKIHKYEASVQFNNVFFPNPFFIEMFQNKEEAYLNDKIASTYFGKYNLHIALKEDIKDKLGDSVSNYLKSRKLVTKLDTSAVRHIGEEELELGEETVTFHDINALEKILLHYNLLLDDKAVLHTPSNKKLQFIADVKFLKDKSIESLLQDIFTAYTIHLAEKLGISVDIDNVNAKDLQNKIKEKYNSIEDEIDVSNKKEENIVNELYKKYGLLKNVHYTIGKDNKILLPNRYGFAYRNNTSNSETDIEDTLLDKLYKEKENILISYIKSLKDYVNRYSQYVSILQTNFSEKTESYKRVQKVKEILSRLNNNIDEALLDDKEKNKFARKIFELDILSGIYELFLVGGHLADDKVKIFREPTELSKRIILRQTAHNVADPSVVPTLNRVVLKAKTYGDVYPETSLLQTYYNLLGDEFKKSAEALTNKELADGFMFVSPLVALLLGDATNTNMEGITKNTIAGITHQLTGIFDKTSTLNLHTQLQDFDPLGKIRKLNENALPDSIIERLNEKRKNYYDKVISELNDIRKEIENEIIEETKKNNVDKKKLQRLKNQLNADTKVDAYRKLLDYEYSLQDYKDLIKEYLDSMKAIRISTALLSKKQGEEYISLDEETEKLVSDLKKVTLDLLQNRGTSKRIAFNGKNYILSNKQNFNELYKQIKKQWEQVGDLYFNTAHEKFKLDIDLVFDINLHLLHILTDETGSKTYTGVKYNADAIENSEVLDISDYVSATQFGEVTKVTHEINPYEVNVVSLPSQISYLVMSKETYKNINELSNRALEKYRNNYSLSTNVDDESKSKVVNNLLQSISDQYSLGGNELIASKIQDNGEASLYEPTYEREVGTAILKPMKRSSMPKVAGDRKVIGDATGIGMYIFEDIETGNTYTLRDLLLMGIVKQNKYFRLQSYAEKFASGDRVRYTAKRIEKEFKNKKTGKITKKSFIVYEIDEEDLDKNYTSIKIFNGLNNKYDMVLKEDSNNYYQIREDYADRFIVRPLQTQTIRHKNTNRLVLGNKLIEAIKLLKTDSKAFDNEFVIAPAEIIMSNDFKVHYKLGDYASPAVYDKKLKDTFWKSDKDLISTDRKDIKVVSIRIPTTSRASFRNSKIVGFVENMNNILFLPYESQYIEGSDNDGDSATIIAKIPNNENLVYSNKYYDSLEANLSLSENFVKSITPIDNTLILEKAEKYTEYIDKNLSELKQKDAILSFPFRMMTGLNKINSQIQNQGSQKLVGYFVKFNEVYSYLKMINKDNNIDFVLPEINKDVANSFGLKSFKGERGNKFYVHFNEKVLDIQPIIDKLTQTVLDDSKYNATGKQNVTAFTTNLINALLLYGADINEILDFIGGGYDEETKRPNNTILRELSDAINIASMKGIVPIKMERVVDRFFKSKEELETDENKKKELINQKEFIKTLLDIAQQSLKLQKITNINRYKNNFEDYLDKIVGGLLAFQDSISVKNTFYGDTIQQIVSESYDKVSKSNNEVNFIENSSSYFLKSEFGKVQVLENASLLIKDLAEIYPYYREDSFRFLERIYNKKIKSAKSFFTLFNSFKNIYYDSLSLGYVIDNLDSISVSDLKAFLDSNNLSNQEVYVNKYSTQVDRNNRKEGNKDIVEIIVPDGTNVNGVYYKVKYTLSELLDEIGNYAKNKGNILSFEGRYAYTQMLASFLEAVFKKQEDYKPLWSVFRIERDTFGSMMIERRKAITSLSEDEIIFSQDIFSRMPSGLLSMFDLYSVLTHKANSYRSIRGFLPSLVQKKYQDYAKEVASEKGKVKFFGGIIDGKAVFEDILVKSDKDISLTHTGQRVRNHMVYTSKSVYDLIKGRDKGARQADKERMVIYEEVSSSFGKLKSRLYPVETSIGNIVVRSRIPISLLSHFNTYAMSYLAFANVRDIASSEVVTSTEVIEETTKLQNQETEELYQLDGREFFPVFTRESNDELLLSNLKHSFLEFATDTLKKAGVEVKIENNASATWKGKIENNVVYFNIANIDLDTGFHEIGHYQVALLKKNFPDVYEELSNLIRNTELYKEVLRRYNGIYDKESDFVDEAITELIGLYNTKRYAEIQYKTGNFFGAIMSLIRNIIDKLNRYINDKLFGITDIEKKKIYHILNDYASNVLYGNVQITDDIRSNLSNTIYYKLGSSNFTNIFNALGYSTNEVTMGYLSEYAQEHREYYINSFNNTQAYINLLGKPFDINDKIVSITTSKGKVDMSWEDFKQAIKMNNEEYAKKFFYELQKQELNEVINFYKGIGNPIQKASELNKIIKSYEEKRQGVSDSDVEFSDYVLAKQQLKYLKLFPDYKKEDKIYLVNKSSSNEIAQLANQYDLLDDHTNIIVLERALPNGKTSYRLINIANKGYDWKDRYHQSTGFINKFSKMIEKFAYGLEGENYTLEDTLSYQTIILAKILLAKNANAQIGDLGLVKSLSESDSSFMVRKVFPNEYNERLRLLLQSNFQNKFVLNSLHLERILKDSYKIDDSSRLMPDYLSFLEGYYTNVSSTDTKDFPTFIEDYLLGKDTQTLLYAIESRIKQILKRYPNIQEEINYKNVYSDNLYLEFYYLVKTYFSLVTNNKDAYNSLDDLAKISSYITTDIENKNPYFNFLYEKYNNAKLLLKKKFDEYVRRVDNVFAEYKSKIQGIAFTNDEGKFYERLFKYQDVVVNGKVEKFNTFELIKPIDPEWKQLNNAERKFIERYSDLLSELYLQAFKHRFGSVEGVLKYKEIEHIAKYLVPPMFKVDDFSLLSESAESSLQNFENILSGNQRTSKAKDYSDLPLMLYSMVNSLGSTAVRDGIIGKANGQLDINLNKKLSTDLRSILNFFYINTERYGILQDTKTAWNIARIMSKLRQIETGREQSNIVELIDSFAQKVLFNERIKFAKDALTRSIEKTGLIAESVSTLAALALNISSNTKAFIVSINKIIASTFAGRKDVFGTKELAKAVKILPFNMEKAFFLAEKFQFVNEDQLRWAVSKRIGTTQRDMFNTRAGMDMFFMGDKMSDMYIKLLVLTAQMIKEGTWEAYSLQEVNGMKELVYDKRKDKRANELKEYILENRIKQGLQGKGDLNDAYDANQIRRIELILNRVGAGLTEGSQVYLSSIPFGRALLKFKLFNMPFINNVLKPKGRNFNYKRLEVVNDKGKREVVELMPYEESIIRTLLRSLIIVLKTRNTRILNEQFSEEQMSSLRWAVSNIIYTMSMFLAFMMLDDEEKERDRDYVERRRFLFNILRNIYSDMNIFGVLSPTGIFNLNGLVSVKGVGNLAEATWYWLTLDFDKGFRKTMNSVGVLNSVEEFYKAFNGEGYHNLNNKIRKGLQEDEQRLKDDIDEWLEIE